MYAWLRWESSILYRDGSAAHAPKGESSVLEAIEELSDSDVDRKLREMLQPH